MLYCVLPPFCSRLVRRTKLPLLVSCSHHVRPQRPRWAPSTMVPESSASESRVIMEKKKLLHNAYVITCSLLAKESWSDAFAYTPTIVMRLLRFSVLLWRDMWPVAVCRFRANAWWKVRGYCSASSGNARCAFLANILPKRLNLPGNNAKCVDVFLSNFLIYAKYLTAFVHNHIQSA